MVPAVLTGSSGWLGRFLAPRLRRDGHEVVGLDVVDGKDTTVVGSVFDRSLIDRIFTDNDITTVVHCGALHKPDIARYSARAFVDVNVGMSGFFGSPFHAFGTSQRADDAKACRAKRV
ncbi:NAD-dependent epimerase/dehydratase family protein [Stieleria neptunia]|uniref:NAD-dependent epimerase/dehydratase family protein n=1 Tax=Stieleria neptunia TaxID=2527979 RepID=UPI0036F1A9D9